MSGSRHLHFAAARRASATSFFVCSSISDGPAFRLTSAVVGVNVSWIICHGQTPFERVVAVPIAAHYGMELEMGCQLAASPNLGAQKKPAEPGKTGCSPAFHVG